MVNDMNIDKHAVRELVLHLENESGFYRQTEMLRKNYAKKKAKDVFDPILAIKGIDSLVLNWFKTREFLQVYTRDFANTFKGRNGIANRQLVCSEILAGWTEEIEELAR